MLRSGFQINCTSPDDFNKCTIAISQSSSPFLRGQVVSRRRNSTSLIAPSISRQRLLSLRATSSPSSSSSPEGYSTSTAERNSIEQPQRSGRRVVVSGDAARDKKLETLRERNEKLTLLQRELLRQLEERKQLHSALLQSLDEPPKQTIAAFNESNQGGLPPVSSVAAAVSQPAALFNSPSIALPPVSEPSSVPPSVRSIAKPPTAGPSASPTSRSPPLSSPPPPVRSVPPSPAVSSPASSAKSPPSPLPPFQSAVQKLQQQGTRAAGATPPAASPSPVSFSHPPAPPSPPPPPPQPVYPSPPPPVSSSPSPPVAPSSAKAVTRTSKVSAAVTAPPLPRTAPLAAPPRAAASQSELEASRERGKEREGSGSSEGAKEGEKPPPLAGPNVMNVVLVASEMAPWSKTGGLGDVMGALPKALARRGHRVMAIAPRYSNYEDTWDTGVRKRYNVGGQDIEIGYFHGYIDGVDFVFIDAPIFHHVSGNIYAGSREEVLKRQVLLCKAAIEAIWHVPCGGVPYGDGNCVLIANDWHTALIPVYLQAYYRDNGLMQFTRSVLVIHNMAHQGRGPVAEYRMLGLPDHYLDKFKLYDPVGGEHMNIFMAGLICAHRLVAVSHGYAWEIQTQMGGWGLDQVIRDQNFKLRGVVNGIDTREWSPETDSFLDSSEGYAHFSLANLKEGKAQCKAALQRELGLPVRPEVPLLGFIGRLDYQKGVDIIGEALPWMMDQDIQLVMLGTGRADLEDMLREFEGKHKDKVRGWVGFSVKMAHRITAGVDILLMPSRFEPCGLNQLYAMRYGTVPVVHAVGGLRDTVRAFDPFADEGLGWTFETAEAGGLIHALGNATYTFKEYKDSWEGIQRRGMSQNLSWDNAAEQYEEVLIAAKYSW